MVVAQTQNALFPLPKSRLQHADITKIVQTGSLEGAARTELVDMPTSRADA